MSRIPHGDMSWELARLVGSKAHWLANFSSGRNKRPDWEIERRKEELRVLEQAQNDYRRAAERDAKNEENAA